MGEVGTVYAIRHNPTGRIYVGSTTDVRMRIAAHMSNLRNNRHPSVSMQQDFNEYGGDYSVAILYKRDLEKADLLQVEHDFMTILNTRESSVGYNENDPSRAFDPDTIRWTTIKGASAKSRRSRKRGDYQNSKRLWLYKARISKGLTQADVAKKLFISESAYGSIESERRHKKMDVQLAAKLAEILDISIMDIIDLENAPDEAGEARDDDA